MNVELFAATKNGREKELTRATANSTKSQHNIQRKDNLYSSVYIHEWNYFYHVMLSHSDMLKVFLPPEGEVIKNFRINCINGLVLLVLCLFRNVITIPWHSMSCSYKETGNQLSD
jgi:hypothetical protein